MTGSLFGCFKLFCLCEYELDLYSLRTYFHFMLELSAFTFSFCGVFSLGVFCAIPWCPYYCLQSFFFCSVTAYARFGGHICMHTCVSLHAKLCLFVVCVSLSVWVHVCSCIFVCLYIGNLVYVHACFFLFTWGVWYYQYFPCYSLVCGVADGRECLGCICSLPYLSILFCTNKADTTLM